MSVEFIQVTPLQLEQLITKVVKEQVEELQNIFKPKEPLELLSRKETAQLLKINVSTLHNWVSKGVLEPHHVQGRVYFKRSEIEKTFVKLKTKSYE